MIENYNEYKKIIDENLMYYMPEIDSKCEPLYDAVKYSLMAGGKRLRSVLLLASCDFAKGNIKAALPFACALEYIHTYSLIHDDLPAMDNDDYRRGVLTNHKVFGEGMAILAGDGLLNTAFEVMNKNLLLYLDDEKELHKRINAMYTIVKCAGVGGMIAGQSADIENEEKECSNEMLEYIHLNKTGALFVAAIKAGLYIAGCDDEMMNKMTIYAENLGLAYQIADDILDVTGNFNEMGKEIGADNKKNKITYVSKNGIENAKSKLSKLTQNAVDVISDYYDNAEFFRDLVIKLEKRTK